MSDPAETDLQAIRQQTIIIWNENTTRGCIFGNTMKSCRDLKKYFYAGLIVQTTVRMIFFQKYN